MDRDNLHFLTEKEEAIRSLRAKLLEDIVNRNLPALSNPPSPEEIARLWESLDGGMAGFAGFCRAFSGSWGSRAASVFSDGDEEADDTARIAYLRSAYSDRAYRRFSPLFGHVTASYFPGFREVAEEVYAGRATHAILPVWNSSDGALLSFRRLLSR